MPFPLLAMLPQLLPALMGAAQSNQQQMQPDPISPVKPGGGVSQDAISRRMNQQQESPLGLLQLGLSALGKQPPELQQKVGPQLESAIQKLNPSMNRGIV